MLKQFKVPAFALATVLFAGSSAFATEYTVEMKNKGDAGAMV